MWWAAESTIIRDGAAQLSSSSDWLVQNAARRQRWLLNGWLPFGLDQRFLELMLVQRIPERLVARMNPGLEPSAWGVRGADWRWGRGLGDVQCG